VKTASRPTFEPRKTPVRSRALALVTVFLVAQLDTQSEPSGGSREHDPVIHPCGPSTDRSRAPLTARWGSQQGWQSHRRWYGRRVVDNVNDEPIHYPSQSKFDGACNVSLVNEAERLRRVPLEPRDHLRYGRQMSVPIAVDKGETENAPVESAIAKFVLRGDLACGIRELRIGRVIFEAGMGCVRIIEYYPGERRQASCRSSSFAVRRPRLVTPISLHVSDVSPPPWRGARDRGCRISCRCTSGECSP
jgi:hypothetical protein